MTTKRSEVEAKFDQLISILDSKKNGTKIQLLDQAIDALRPIVDILDTDLEAIKPPPSDTPLKGRPPNTKRKAIKIEIVQEENKKKAKLVEKRYVGRKKKKAINIQCVGVLIYFLFIGAKLPGPFCQSLLSHCPNFAQLYRKPRYLM
jgi:hypothetical protein